MLQEKKKKGLSISCVKFLIILSLIISGFLGFVFGWFIVGLYFYIITLGSKGSVGIGDIFEISGLNDCITDLMGNLEGVEDRFDNEYKEKYKKIRENKNVKEFLRKLKEAKNIKEKQKRNNKLSTEGFNSLKIPNIKEKKKPIISFNDKLNSNKHKSSFNRGKSIWDDYESVIDIMAKNNKK